jgi:cbb3-type cytochrome oxidase maturation protein
MTGTLTFCLILAGIASATAAGFFFIGAVRSGQLDDLEETKFRMLREDENR